MEFKRIVLTERGGPETLKMQTAPLVAPQEKELQIKVLACGVGRTDVAMRYGYYPFAPKIPFVPGYEIVGEITAIGQGVSTFAVGDRVAALTVYGGYAEYIFLAEEEVVPVPATLHSEEAVALILNYITAYQMLHRELQVQPGATVLVTGASGGVGSALLDLGKLAGLKIYGTASASKHATVEAQGVIPLDYRSEDWVEQLKSMEPNGLDYVIDGVGGAYIPLGFSLLKQGGRMVGYGFPNFWGMLKGLLQLQGLSLLPNGRKGSFYGISANYRQDKSTIHADLRTLFQLLEAGKIKPLIAKRYGLLEAAAANRYLESGQVQGKIVLVA